MDRELYLKLTGQLAHLSTQTYFVFKNENFGLGYFNQDNSPNSIVYFSKANLASGFINPSNFVGPTFLIRDTINQYRRLPIGIIPKRLNNIFDYLANYNIANYNQTNFSYKDKRLEFMDLCKKVDSIKVDILKRIEGIKFVKKKGLKPLGEISKDDISIPYIVCVQKVIEYFNGPSLTSKYNQLNELFQALPDDAYSPLKNQQDDILKSKIDSFEYVFYELGTQLLFLKKFMNLENLGSLMAFYILNEKIGICKPIDERTLSMMKSEFESELLELPFRVVEVNKDDKLSDEKQLFYNNYFNEKVTVIKEDYRDNEIVIGKKSWIKYHDIVSGMEIKNLIKEIPFDNAKHSDLNMTNLPFIDSQMQFILRFLYYKVYFIEKNFDASLDSLLSKVKPDERLLSKGVWIKRLYDLYSKIVGSQDRKIRISSTLKLPKWMSDSFLKCLILVLEKKLQLNGELQENESNLSVGFELEHPNKFFWNKDENGLLIMALKDLYEKKILTKQAVKKIGSNFFCAKSKMTPIRLSGLYLDLILKGEKRELYIIFENFRLKYYPNEPIERFAQMYKLSIPSKFKGAQLDESSLKSAKKSISRTYNNHVKKMREAK